MAVARTVRDDDSEAAPAGAAAQSVLHLPRALARDWRVVGELASSGAEADLLVVAAANGERRVAKIYRARVEPKTEVLQRVGGTSFEHIVRLYDHGFSDGRWYELLEYIELGSLEDLIRADGPRLAEATVSNVLWELTTAIEHLHEHDVVHRDIKPSNVLVRSRVPLDLVLTDFGIASVLDQASKRYTAANRTIAYAAPETAAGEVSPAADWWALGIILVEILTGRHPFAGGQPGTLLNERVIVSRLAQMPVDELASGVAAPWRALCRGLLRREAKNRWRYDEIARWIRHDPTLTVAAEQEASRSGLVPFYFAGNHYDSLPDIAAAFGENWQEARKSVERNHFSEWVKDELKNNEWRQFLSDLDRDCENLDERILRICVKLDPSATPVFCGYRLDARGLARLARASLSNVSGAESMLAGLLERRTLLVAGEVTGIERYRELHEAWQREIREFEALRNTVAAAGGPSAGSASYRHARAELLLSVVPLDDGPYIDALRAEVSEAVNRDVLEIGWFRALGDPLAASPAVAFLMKATARFAEPLGRRERDSREAARRADTTRIIRNSIAAAAGAAVLGGIIFAMVQVSHSQTPSTFAVQPYQASTVSQPVNAVAAPAAPSTSTATVVSEYYKLWNHGDYRAMYGMLSSRYRSQHPFATWEQQHSSVLRITVQTASTSDPLTVDVLIESTDRVGSKAVDSEYRGTWSVVPESGQLSLDRVALNQTK